MAGKAGVWRVLRNTNFVRLWLGQMVSFIGDYFYFLAIPMHFSPTTEVSNERRPHADPEDAGGRPDHGQGGR